MKASKADQTHAMIILILGFLLVATVAVGFAKAEVLPITWQWTSPTEGSPVEIYEGQVRWYFEDAPTDTLEFDWASENADTTFVYHDYNSGSQIRIRVRGVDDIGGIGPFSEWSEWFIYFGKPGQTGSPAVIQVGNPPEN